jgi:hypothetical protein
MLNVTNQNYCFNENLVDKFLPKELIIRIFSYLDVVTLCRAAQVSKVNFNLLKFTIKKCLNY